MPLRLKALLFIVIGTATAISVATLALVPLQPAIGGWPGLALWVALVAITSVSPVRMPGGALVNVAIAPLIAAAVLGGPSAAIVAALIGTLEW